MQHFLISTGIDWYKKDFTKMKVIYKLMIFTIIFFIALSCSKDDIDSNQLIDETKEQPDVYHKSHLTGLVKDVNGKYLDEVSISSRFLHGKTSRIGIFDMPEIPINEYGSLIKISKSGFEDKYIYLLAHKDQFNNIDITLEEKKSQLSFLANVGMTTNITTGVNLLISPNSFGTYNGEVFYKIDFDLTNQGNVLPNQIPVTTNKLEKKFLGDAIKFRLSFETNSGEPLSPTQDIKITIDKNLKNWPEEINNLFFNKDRERWYESTSITSDKSTYNLLTKNEFIALGKLDNLTMISGNTQKLYSGSTIIASQGSDNFIEIVSDQNGDFSTYVKKGVSTKLSTKSTCGEWHTLTDLTTNQTAQSVGILSLSGLNALTITSTVKNCSGGDITLGDNIKVLLVSEKNRYLFSQTANTNEFIIPNCDDKLIEALIYQKDVLVKTFSFTPENSNADQYNMITSINCSPINFGRLKIGDEVLDISGDKIIITQFTDKSISIFDIGMDISIESVGGVTKAGKYKLSNMITIQPKNTSCTNVSCDQLILEVIEIGAVGENVVALLYGKLNNDDVYGEFVTKLK